ncbi:hypothetical protein C2845_PM13G11300 [Panicum miliaceum]|uniref:SRP54-type proteins GTP-binding domain-containing protein n=1 Tax=Panicum miliaceum TaxID=4540 RepID=A0A3L6RL88_PANMI|nr:hypothetical protein C2845_PM13G11300 [Panicum miliaceum]
MKAPSMEVSTPALRSMVASKGDNTGAGEGTDTADAVTLSFPATFSPFQSDVLTKENIAEPIRDIRRALLEADVSLPVVRRFIESVSEKAVGTDSIRGVRPDQQLVKIVNDELVQLLGGEVSDLVFAKSGPTIILLADVYRPAAIDQLTILGKQVGVPVYSEGTEAKPPQITKNAVEEAKSKNIDAIVVDIAGRLQIDKAMMDELKEVKKAVNPTEVLLVVDAMTGQEAAALVTTFNIEIGITGAILTKLDGDSRGGAALSVKEMRQEEAIELQKKIMSAKFDFNDLKQSQNVAKMGSMSRVIGMIPGMNKVSQLVAQLFQMRAQMQKLMGMVQGQEAIAGMGDLMDSLKAEEKAPAGTARRKRNSKPKRRDLDAVLS